MNITLPLPAAPSLGSQTHSPLLSAPCLDRLGTNSWRQSRRFSVLTGCRDHVPNSSPNLGYSSNLSARDWEITGLIPLFYFLCQHMFITNILICPARLIVGCLLDARRSQNERDTFLLLSGLGLPLNQTRCGIQSLPRRTPQRFTFPRRGGSDYWAP